jgi:hypothetical protein
MRRIAWVLLILLMTPSYGVAALPPEIVPGLKTTDVDELIIRAMTAFQVPGIAVGIVKDGEVVYAAGHGVLEIGGSQAVDSETLFAIASIHEQAFVKCQARSTGDLRGPTIHSASSRRTHHDSNFESAPFTHTACLRHVQ